METPVGHPAGEEDIIDPANTPTTPSNGNDETESKRPPRKRTLTRKMRDLLTAKKAERLKESEKHWLRIQECLGKLDKAADVDDLHDLRTLLTSEFVHWTAHMERVHDILDQLDTEEALAEQRHLQEVHDTQEKLVDDAMRNLDRRIKEETVRPHHQAIEQEQTGK